MTHHFGVLIPSTNTTVETELARLPAGYQAHFARLMTSTPGHPFAPSRDEDIDYQSKLLGTAKVEMVILIQTSASLFADDYDETTTRRMSAAAGGVPAITSAHAMGRALRALGARRIAPRLAVLGGGQRAGTPLLLRQARARDRGARRLCGHGFVRHRQARTRKRARCLRPDRPAGDRRLRGARRQFPDDGVDCRVGARVQEAGGELHAGGGLGDGATARRRAHPRLRPPARSGFPAAR